jgi:hypothetical protein
MPLARAKYTHGKPAQKGVVTMVPLIVACSGPGAAHSIARNTSASLILFFVAAAFAVLACLRLLTMRHGRATGAWVIALAAAHPGWWMSSLRGDCGVDRLICSAVATCACLALGVPLLRVRNSGGGSQRPDA